MTDFFIIKESDVLQTRFNDEDITITVKELAKLDFIPSVPTPQIDFSMFWEDFVSDLLSQDFAKKFSHDEKLQLTGFIKQNIKNKLLKNIL